MNSFQVSVIIPVYNAELFIKESVLSCSILPEVREIILVDDASNDDSINICKLLEKENPKVRFCQHKDFSNHGPAATRNVGIIKATSEFVSFLDADDIYLENRFHEENKIFSKENDVDAVYNCSHTIFLSEEGKEMYYKTEENNIYTLSKKLDPKELFNALLFYGYGRLHTSAITVRKKIFNDIGFFNEKLKWAEDTELWLRLALQGNMVAGNIQTPVSLRRIHNLNIVHQTKSARDYKDKMYIELLKWAINRNYSFALLNCIHNASRLHTYHASVNPKLFFWGRIIKFPWIMIHSFFWKKLILLYLKSDTNR